MDSVRILLVSAFTYFTGWAHGLAGQGQGGEAMSD